MPLKTNRTEELPSVNLTPMIDVVFLLIIFFMVGTQFTESERDIAITLPGAGAINTMLAPPDRREITVSADGTLHLDGQGVTAEQLMNQLQQMRSSYPDLRVVVRADANAKYQHVVTAFGAANRAGVRDVSTTAARQSATIR